MAENRIDLLRPDAPALAEPGPHPVGVRTVTLTHPDQIDVLKTVEGAEPPRTDRILTVEIWYPAVEGTEAGAVYDTVTRDGSTPIQLVGSAARDAAPNLDRAYPLVILSHGYPGNRFLMSHLGENLASKGYVVASIDHQDSTYSDQAAFGSTLVNRPLDQRFILDAMAELSAGDGPLAGMINADCTAIIGYSMGGYGALIFGGAGVTQTAVDLSWGAPAGLLSRHRAGAEDLAEIYDPRVKALIAIGPWGRARDIWDSDGVAGLRIPTLFIAGSVDTISGYEDGVRQLWREAEFVDRSLLTFDLAGHNAAAPMPAPVESWVPVDSLGFVPFEHYADPVWDTVRMNNILQHFATAYLGKYLHDDPVMDRYLTLIPVAAEGVHSVNDAGQPQEDHTYWTGFEEGTALGLRFETLTAE
ncbi:MAG: dienelactone hydrolase [Pseudomonadota bacterium]